MYYDNYYSLRVEDKVDDSKYEIINNENYMHT